MRDGQAPGLSTAQAPDLSAVPVAAHAAVPAAPAATLPHHAPLIWVTAVPTLGWALPALPVTPCLPPATAAPDDGERASSAHTPPPKKKMNSHYATGGGTSLNHSTILGNVEVGLRDAGVPFKSTRSTNGQGTKNIFRRQLSENPSGSSLEKTNKFIPDRVIKASHLSGSNGADCDLDGANQIVDFKTLQGLSHYDNTSTIPGGTLEKKQKAVNIEYHDRTRKLDSELHGSQQDKKVSERPN